MSWSLVNISTCVGKVTSWNPLKSNKVDSFSYIDLSSVDKDKKCIVDNSVSSILPNEAPSRARQVVQAGDILVSTVRPNLNGIALVTEKFDGATASTGYCVLSPIEQLINSKYLYYWVQSSAFISDMTKKATGANYPAVSDKIIKESEIPLPPLPEQKRIAAILDKADAIRRKRQQAIQLADDFLRTVFLDMFGDIPAKKSDYQLQGCRGFVTASSGKSSTNVLSDKPTQIPIYGGNGINGFATECLYDEPVIVVGRVGQQCAITNITDGPSWVTDNAIVIRVLDTEAYNPFYLAHAFMHSPIRDVVTHLDLPFVNQSMILDTPIPLPPIALQNKFALIREKALRSRETLIHSATQSEKCFASLSQKAFAGEL